MSRDLINKKVLAWEELGCQYWSLVKICHMSPQQVDESLDCSVGLILGRAFLFVRSCTNQKTGG